MIKLKVISLNKNRRNIIKFILCLAIVIWLVLNINTSLVSNIVSSKNININNDKNNNKNNYLDYKILLRESFVFLDTYDNINKLEDINVNNKDKFFEILKSNLGVVGVLAKESKINSDNINDFENIKYINDYNIYNENEKQTTINNIINLENLTKEDKELLNSNFVYIKEYDTKYEIPAKNTNDIFDTDIKSIAKVIKTRVVSEKNKVDKYNTEIGKVKIRNESKHIIDNQSMNFSFNLNNKNNIIIYHTHTSESYTSTEKYNYVQTGNFRSTDLSYSVARVGDVLEHFLCKLNYNVNHSKECHDFPAYNGSYNRALTTIESELSKNTSDIVIDLHRDAIGNNSDYGPTVEIGGEKVAQLMFVIGTNGGGLKHNNWKNNLKFAIEVQEKAEEMYPGLFKPIIVRNARYNQHVSNGAVIIEVGATGNSLEEAESAMKYLSIVLDEYIKEK